MTAAIKHENNQVIQYILRKKEAMIAIGSKGRMKVKRLRKSKTDSEKLEDALVRVNF